MKKAQRGVYRSFPHILLTFFDNISKYKTVRLYSPKLAAVSKGLVKSKGFLIGLLRSSLQIFEFLKDLCIFLPF